MLLVYVFVFGLGLIFGSFLNVLIFRLGVKGGIWTGRSECPRCLAKLQWYDLIPLVSFLSLRAKCRTCKAPISWVYPAVECVTGAAFVGVFMQHWPTIGGPFLFDIVMVCAFIVILFFDALYFIIPDRVVFPAGLLAFAYAVVVHPQNLGNLLLSGFLFAAFFAIIYVVSRGQWMGFGDVKLVFLIGLILGYPLGFWTIVLAVWIAAIIGIALIVFRQARPDTPLPFGSFLAFVSILIIIFEHAIKTNIPAIYWIF